MEKPKNLLHRSWHRFQTCLVIYLALWFQPSDPASLEAWCTFHSPLQKLLALFVVEINDVEMFTFWALHDMTFLGGNFTFLQIYLTSIFYWNRIVVARLFLFFLSLKKYKQFFKNLFSLIMNMRQWKHILLFATTCPKENHRKSFFLQNLPGLDFSSMQSSCFENSWAKRKINKRT